MRELSKDEIKEVSGGIWPYVIGAAFLLYSSSAY